MSRQDHDIDRLFREGLDSPRNPETWEVPSGRVWSGVSERITKRPSAYRLILLLIPILLAMVAWGVLSYVIPPQTDKEEQPHDIAGLDEGAATTDSPEAHEPSDFTGSAPEEDVFSIRDEETAKFRHVTDHLQDLSYAARVSDPVPEMQLQPEDPGASHPLTRRPKDQEVNDFQHVNFENKAEDSEEIQIVDRKISEVLSLPGNDELYLSWQRPFVLSPVTPVIDARRAQRMALGLSLVPSLGTRMLSVPMHQPAVERRLLGNSETPALSLGLATQLSFKLSPVWSLGLGLEYMHVRLNGQSAMQLRYTRAGERPNSRGFFENQYALELNTSFGQFHTEVVVERSAQQQVSEHAFLDFHVNTQHNYRKLSIPLTVEAQLPAGRFTTGISAGLSANVVVQNILAIDAIRASQDVRIRPESSRSARVLGANDIYLGYHLGISLYIPVDHRWILRAGPSVRGGLQPVYRSQALHTRPAILGLDIGMHYRI